MEHTQLHFIGTMPHGRNNDVFLLILCIVVVVIIGLVSNDDIFLLILSILVVLIVIVGLVTTL